MKVLCVSCEWLAEPGGYRVDAGVLRVTCSRCGAEMIGAGAISKLGVLLFGVLLLLMLSFTLIRQLGSSSTP